MWKIWLFFSVFKFSFSAPVETKKGSVAAGDLGGLRCLLMSSPLATCEDIKRYGNDIPKRIQKLYDKVKRPFVETKNEEIIDSSSMELLPTSLLYLIPRIRFQNMSGSTAGNLVRKSPNDDALVMKLSGLLGSDADRQAFLRALGREEDMPDVQLSQAVEHELGRSMALWYPVAAEWVYWHFEIALEAGTPVLAHVPSHFLNRLTPSVIDKFSFHVRNWRPDYTNNTEVWASHPMQVKRMWTHIVVNKLERPKLWFPAMVKYAGYVLLGATPEEIPKLVKLVTDETQIGSLLELQWTPLQARVMFDILHKNFTKYSDPESTKRLSSSLLPRQIQQYDPATTNLEEVEVDEEASLPTKSQWLEHRISYLVSHKKLQNYSQSTWKENIELLENLVPLLPASSLEAVINESLPISAISKITSSSLSYRQTRYLTNNNTAISFDQLESIVGAKHHLKSLSAHALNVQHRGHLPENVQRHLLSHVPASNLALAAVLIEKTYLDIDEKPYLRALLENENHEELLKLLSSRVTTPRMLNWAASLTAIAHESPELSLKIRALPPNVGTVLLAEYRKEIATSEDGWTVENLIESPSSPLLRLLVSNMQCVDMELVNDVDVLPVLGFYVRERKALNLPFPKNMQYCCQKAVTRYLKLKATLRQWTDDSAGLMNLLEPFEVRAVGGYILASLPLDVILSAHVKNYIIKEIGTLSVTELLTATSVANLKILANSFGKNVRDIHLREMMELGNLIWFLDVEHARRINLHHLKLLLETFEPGQPRAPCLNASEREFWRDLLINSLGKPSSWSASTLALLGDLLFVFDEEDFDSVSAVARTEASDIMAKHTSFHVKVDWPGKLTPITYFEACVEALPEEERPLYKTSVRTLLRFYLESAEMLVKTVLRADTMLRVDQQQDENNLSVNADDIENSEENMAVSSEEGRIKRSIPSKRGRIFKRVLNGDKQTSEEDKRREFVVNETRALVMVSADSNEVHISETFPRKSMSVSCDAIRMVGMSSSFVLDEEDMKKMTDEELEDCSEVLGSLDLPQHVRKAVWPRLSKWKETQNLLEVGKLVSAIREDDIADLELNITNPWALEALSVLSQHVTNDDALNLVGDRFLITNSDIQTGLRFGSAAALGHIICRIPKSRQQKLLSHPNVFVQLAPLLGASQLDGYCIQHLIGHAKTAYGEPKDWSAEDIASLGVIVAGLDKADWHKGLKFEALTGVTPAAIANIPPEVLKELSEEQLSRLPALSIAAISPAQSQYLSPSQSEVVERVRRQIPDKDLRASRHASGAAVNITPSIFTWLAVAVAAVRWAF